MWYMVCKASNGITEAIPCIYPLIPFCIALVLWIVYACFRKRCLVAATTHFAALAALGFSIMLGFWFVMSNYGGGGELSFKWVGLPGFATFLIGGFGWAALFGKEQPCEKHQGLTLWSLKKELL